MFVTYSAYCIGACVYLCVCHIASDKVRAGKQCLTTWRRFLVFSKPRKWNQQWRGCDVTVRLSFLLEPRPPISHCSFVIFFLSVPYISISLCLSLYCICLFLPLVCFSPCLYLFFPLLLRCRGVGVCRLFFYEWDALFTLWELFLCRWWTQTVTTLPVLLPSFLWLAKVPLSMATDLR